MIELSELGNDVQSSSFPLFIKIYSYSVVASTGDSSLELRIVSFLVENYTEPRPL